MPGADFDLQIGEQTMPQSQPRHEHDIEIERTISGRGQERGGLKTMISNSSPTEEATIVYLETLPWFMKPYIHTLRAETSPKAAIALQSPVRSIKYQAERDRERGTMLEMTLKIPASSVLTISYDFDKAILRYTEYPPDPNRGFEVAPAVARMMGSDGSTLGYIRTTSLLLYLPTPDFSMPYNVIILTSTVIALGFGSIFNLLVRRFVGADEVPTFRIGRIKGILQGKLMSWGPKFRNRSESHEKSE
ncbi:MAG: Subunit of the glycosylphosphatidylinositol transamidase complex-like protein [Alyxoria varia]|nr:MAG: Subunit of the glycosylphosphatidylinositol transamidase complex-like protein [Alyxoria varia]